MSIKILTIKQISKKARHKSTDPSRNDSTNRFQIEHVSDIPEENVSNDPAVSYCSIP